MREASEPSSLQLETVTNSERVVVVVRGDVDAATAAQLEAVIAAQLSEGATLLELDLTDVGFLDSTGLGVVAGALKRLGTVDGNLVLRNVPASVVELLRITDLLRFVSIADGD